MAVGSRYIPDIGGIAVHPICAVRYDEIIP